MKQVVQHLTDLKIIERGLCPRIPQTKLGIDDQPDIQPGNQPEVPPDIQPDLVHPIVVKQIPKTDSKHPKHT